MAPQGPDARIRIQVLLALGDRDDANAAAQQEALAGRLGLTGAEIDAARAGRCFDVRAAAAVNFALALRVGEPASVERLRALAERAGLAADALVAIERIAAEHEHDLEHRRQPHA